jgi:hypothetical protein
LNRKNFIKHPTGHKLNIRFTHLKNNISPIFLQEEAPRHNPLLQDDYANAKNCISRISDPLWQDICRDLLNMMGPSSVLKIWKSTLGEFSSQDKSLDLICETEETLEFMKQYDFVILGSLQRYFPALKELRMKVILVRSHLLD